MKNDAKVKQTDKTDKKSPFYTSFLDYLKTLAWTIGTALSINARSLLLWTGFTVLLNVAPALVLKFTQVTIDGVANAAQNGLGLGTVLLPIGMIALMQVFGDLIWDFQSWTIGQNMSFVYSTGIMKKLMDLSMRVPVRLFDNPEFNDMINKARSDRQHFSDSLGAIATLLGSTMGAISLFVLAFTLSRPIFFVAIVCCIGIFTVSMICQHLANKINKNQSRLYGMANDYYRHGQDGAEAAELRIFNMGSFWLRKWKKYYLKTNETEIKINENYTKKYMIIYSMCSIFSMVIVIIAITDMSRENLTTGGLTALIGLTGSILNTVSLLNDAFMRSLYGIKSNDLIRKLFRADYPGQYGYREIGESARGIPGAPVFKLDHVSYAYNPQTVAVKNVSLEVKEGEILALVGENGSGKTTLSSILLGLYPPTEGEAYFQGRPYEAYSAEYLSDHIGAAFQDINQYAITLRENIAFGDIKGGGDDEAVLLAIRKGGAEPVLRKLQKGLENRLGKTVDLTSAPLSGGEWQRVSVSRAHMSDKEVLVFDEPAAKLDALAELEQFQNIQQMLKGRTAVLISHRIGFARMADKIAVMDKGELKEYGTHDELIAKNGIYARYFHEQAKWYKQEAAVNE